MLRSLRRSWRRKVADEQVQPHAERRKDERRKEQLSFDGPERRRNRDRRQYVRRVMAGEIQLPDEEGRSYR
jgi:hypothetical protein